MFDGDHCLMAVTRKGLDFLQRIGYAHNDIDPEKIMVEKDGEPVTIDFDSCVRIRERMGAKAGTPFFSDDDATCSRPENDLCSYKLLNNYMEDQLREKHSAALIRIFYYLQSYRVSSVLAIFLILVVIVALNA